MEDFNVKQIFPGVPGEIIEETYTFKLEGKATILDLKEAFVNEEGYTLEQFRMVYRKADMDVPLDLKTLRTIPAYSLLSAQPWGFWMGNYA